MINHNGKKIKNKTHTHTHTYITESLCCIIEINIVKQLYFNKNKNIKCYGDVVIPSHTVSGCSQSTDLKGRYRDSQSLKYLLYGLYEKN